MSLIGVLAALAVTGVLAMTIMTLVDYMTRSSVRMAVQEGVSAAVSGVLMCVQRTSAECGTCFYANAPPDVTPLSIPPLGGAVTQDIGSIQLKGLGAPSTIPVVTRGATLPAEPRVTLTKLRFEEANAGARVTTVIGGNAFTTLYGKIIMEFEGVSGMAGGAALRPREILVSMARNDSTGVVEYCGIGGRENFACTAANSTYPACGSCAGTPAYYVTGFSTTGEALCGCFCVTGGGPAPGPAGPGPAGPAGPPPPVTK